MAACHSGLDLGLIPEPIEPCSRSGPSCTDAAMTIAGLVLAARPPSEARP